MEHKGCSDLMLEVQVSKWNTKGVLVSSEHKRCSIEGDLGCSGVFWVFWVCVSLSISGLCVSISVCLLVFLFL